MENISRKSVEVADLRYKLDLQLFGEDDGTPNLEDAPEFREDAREFSKMDSKIDKFMEEKAPKADPKAEDKPENKPVEEVKAATEEVATPEPKPKQDAETNKAFQEMRKQLEAEQAKAKKADEVISKQWGHLGVHTVEQYEQRLQEEREAEESQRYVDAGLTPEEIQKLKDYDRIQAETSQEAQTKQQQEYLSQWEKLYEAYPGIVETAQAFKEGKDPEWYTAEMKAEIARGASPIAAYRNAHFETILQSKLNGVKETAAQDAMDKINSKDHLAPNASTGGEVDHVEIDPVQMSMYRKLTGKSDAEIRKFHKKSLAGG